MVLPRDELVRGGCKIAFGQRVFILCAPHPVRRAWHFRLFAFPTFFSVVVFSEDFVLYIFLSDNGVGGETRRRRQEWGRKAANPFREKGSAGEWPLTLGTVAKTLGVCPTLPPNPTCRFRRFMY